MFVSRKQTRICRGTFSAELLSCLDSCGLAMNISLALAEVLSGPKSSNLLAALLDSGKLSLETELIRDAASVYDAAIALETKCPSEFRC